MALEVRGMEKGPQAKECRQPLEAGKGKETESSLKAPERTQPCQHHDCRLLT